jgi:phospholipid/cholesterol/gamma-HCH transport system permease protein
MVEVLRQKFRIYSTMATRVTGWLGEKVCRQWNRLQYEAAVIGTVLWVGARPRSWGRIPRQALARQILTTGVEPLNFVCAMAVFVGISIVVQLTFWAGEAGQSQLLGPLLVAVVARELGPLLINLVVIVRSGSAITTELGLHRADAGAGFPAAPAADPLLHLAMPRILGLAISTFCLTVVFILVALASGYVFAGWMGQGSRDIVWFADTVSRALQPKDVLNILAKGILPALFAGASCCLGGLRVGGTLTAIPSATQRALMRSVTGLFVISAVVSLLTYF